MNRKTLAVLIGVHALTLLTANADDLARAFARWQRNPCLVSALHVATCGLFLAEDVAALG